MPRYLAFAAFALVATLAACDPYVPGPKQHASRDCEPMTGSRICAVDDTGAVNAGTYAGAVGVNMAYPDHGPGHR